MNEKTINYKAAVACLFLLLAFLTVRENVFASQTLAISADTAGTFAGDTVTVAVAISDNPGFVGLKVRLHYDEKALTPISGTKGKLGERLAEEGWSCVVNTAPKGGDSYIVIQAINTNLDNLSDTCDNGALAEITFQVNETAPAGDYPLRLEVVHEKDIVNETVQAVQYRLEDGKISITGLRADLPAGEHRTGEKGSEEKESDDKESGDKESDGKKESDKEEADQAGRKDETDFTAAGAQKQEESFTGGRETETGEAADGKFRGIFQVWLICFPVLFLAFFFCKWRAGRKKSYPSGS